MIIFGTRVSNSARETGGFICPNCKTQQGYTRYILRRWFTLYFIPVIPLNQCGDQVECYGCKSRYEPDVLHPSAQQTLAGVGQPAPQQPGQAMANEFANPDPVYNPFAPDGPPPTTPEPSPQQPSTQHFGTQQPAAQQQPGAPVSPSMSGQAYPPATPYGSVSGNGGRGPANVSQQSRRISHTSTVAILSLILGVVLTPMVIGCPFLFFSAVVGIVLGHLGLSEIRNGKGFVKGRTAALSGLLLCYTQLVIGGAFLVWILVATPSDRSATRRVSKPYIPKSSTQGASRSPTMPSGYDPNVNRGIPSGPAGDAFAQQRERMRAARQNNGTRNNSFPGNTGITGGSAFGNTLPQGNQLNQGNTPAPYTPNSYTPAPYTLPPADVSPMFQPPKPAAPSNTFRPPSVQPPSVRNRNSIPRAPFGPGTTMRGMSGSAVPQPAIPGIDENPFQVVKPRDSPFTPGTAVANAGKPVNPTLRPNPSFRPRTRATDTDDAELTEPIHTFPDMGWGVKSIAFSPDDRWLAVGKSDDHIWIFDVASGDKLASTDKLQSFGNITQLQFNSTGRSIIAAGYRGEIRHFPVSVDGKLGQSRPLVPHRSEVKSLEIASTDKFVVSGTKKELIWQSLDGSRTRRANVCERSILAISIDDQKLLATVTDGYEIATVDLRSGDVVKRLELKRRYIHSADFSPDGSKLVMSLGSEIAVVDVDSGARLATQKSQGVTWAVKFSRDGNLIAYSTSGKSSGVAIWDFKSGKVDTQINVKKYSTIKTIAFSHHRDSIATIPDSAGQSLRVYQLP